MDNIVIPNSGDKDMNDGTGGQVSRSGVGGPGLGNRVAMVLLIIASSHKLREGTIHFTILWELYCPYVSPLLHRRRLLIYYPLFASLRPCTSS